MTKFRLMLLPVLTLLSACAFGQTAHEQPKATAIHDAALVTEAPERIHIIGASVSGGFRDGPLFGAKTQGDSVTLQQMLRKWCGSEVKVTTHAPLEMWNLFQDPEGTGEKEVTMALRRKPDVIMAIDFPFWFAYGYIDGDEAQARGKLLEKGLAYLSKFEVPVVIGNLPDMTGAATRMLRPAQIPTEPVLKQLNERLVKFAAEHKGVQLVELASVMKQLRTEGIVLPLADGALKTAPAALLQEDRLHATRLGMAMLAFTLQDTLRGLFPKDHPLHAQRWTFEQFVEAAGADGELEVLKEKAAAKK